MNPFEIDDIVLLICQKLDLFTLVRLSISRKVIMPGRLYSARFKHFKRCRVSNFTDVISNFDRFMNMANLRHDGFFKHGDITFSLVINTRNLLKSNDISYELKIRNKINYSDEVLEILNKLGYSVFIYRGYIITKTSRKEALLALADLYEHLPFFDSKGGWRNSGFL